MIGRDDCSTKTPMYLRNLIMSSRLQNGGYKSLQGEGYLSFNIVFVNGIARINKRSGEITMKNNRQSMIMKFWKCITHLHECFSLCWCRVNCMRSLFWEPNSTPVAINLKNWNWKWSRWNADIMKSCFGTVAKSFRIEEVFCKNVPNRYRDVWMCFVCYDNSRQYFHQLFSCMFWARKRFIVFRLVNRSHSWCALGFRQADRARR